MGTDFGKIAYLKVCDLETQMNWMSRNSSSSGGTSSGGKRSSTGAVFFRERNPTAYSTEYVSKAFDFVGGTGEIVVDFYLETTISVQAVIYYYLNGNIFDKDTLFSNNGLNNFRRSFNLLRQSGTNTFSFKIVGKGSVIGYEVGVYGQNMLSSTYDGNISMTAAATFGYLFFESPRNTVNVYSLYSVGHPYDEAEDCRISVPYSTFQFVHMESSGTRGLFRTFMLYLDEASSLYIREYIYSTNTFGNSKFLASNVTMLSVSRSNVEAGALLLYVQNGKTYRSIIEFSNSTSTPTMHTVTEISFGAVNKLYVYCTMNCEYFFARDKSNKWQYCTSSKDYEVQKFSADSFESMAIFSTSSNLCNIFICRDGKIFKSKVNANGTFSEEKFVTFGDDVFTSNMGIIARRDTQIVNPYSFDTGILTT